MPKSAVKSQENRVGTAALSGGCAQKFGKFERECEDIHHLMLLYQLTKNSLKKKLKGKCILK